MRKIGSSLSLYLYDSFEDDDAAGRCASPRRHVRLTLQTIHFQRYAASDVSASAAFSFFFFFFFFLKHRLSSTGVCSGG